MPFSFVANLRMDLAQPCSPWEWNFPPPEHARASKEAYHKWRQLPSIAHQFYSPFEGVNPHARVSAPAAGSEGNPPVWLSGLVMDIDQNHTDLAIDQAVSYLPASRRPQWVERSASGNCRLVWVFASRVSIPSFDFATHLMKKFADAWGLDKTLGGFDVGAFIKASQYYCNGGVWRRLPTIEAVGAAETAAVQFAAATTFSWGSAREWAALPLDKVYKELEKNHDFLAAWGDTPFEVGARGKSWFVPGSESANSAVVLEKGMYTFSGRATKSFFPWIDILGRNFVEGSTATQVSEAVREVFFDGKLYYRKLPSGQWRGFGKEDINSYLKTTCFLSDKAPKGSVSDLAKAIQHIHDYKFVDGAAPVVFRPAGLTEVAGKQVLNTSTRKALAASPGPCRGWGVDFPYIASVFDGLFPVGYEGRAYMLAWLKVFYLMAVAELLASGQNIVIAGGAGKGKTLFSRAIVGGLVSGYAECGDFLMGEDSFGGELFEAALWVMDDNSVAANPEIHRRFSEALKKMAANRSHRVAVKYAMPTSTQWMGRVIVTCNDDPKSVQMLPSLDHSIADKLLLFRVPPDSKKADFLSHEEGNAVIARELPFFARYLTDFVIPEEARDPDPRFGGIKAWADPFLVRTANQSSATAPLAEILDDFRQQFLTANPSLEVWRGTSAQLHRILNSDNDRKEAMRSYPILRLSNQLATLEQRGYPIVSEDSGPNRVWTINLKDLEPEPEVVVDVAPQPAPAPKPKAAKVTKKKETANA